MNTINRVLHKQLIMAFLATQRRDLSVLDIGDQLYTLGCDDLSNGGFWVWSMNSDVEYYSPKFRSTLGYEGEEDFPSLSTSWKSRLTEEDLRIVFNNYDKAVKAETGHPYHQKVTYLKKDNLNRISVICSGTIVKDKNGLPIMLIGSHIID